MRCLGGTTVLVLLFSTFSEGSGVEGYVPVLTISKGVVLKSLKNRKASGPDNTRKKVC